MVALATMLLSFQARQQLYVLIVRRALLGYDTATMLAAMLVTMLAAMLSAMLAAKRV